MKRFVLVLVLICLTGADYEGLDVLPASSERFPCKAVLGALAPLDRPAFQFLYGSFGKSLKCASAFIVQSGKKPHLLMIHPANWTCDRAGRTCPRGEKLTPYLFGRRVRHLLRKLFPIITPYTRVIISTGLEDTWNRRTYLKYLKELKKYWGGLTMRSPTREKSYKPADYLQNHTLNCNFGDICSLDGALGVTVPQARRWRKINDGAIALLLWKCEWQGACGGPFIPYESRPFHFDKDDIEFVEKVF